MDGNALLHAVKINNAYLHQFTVGRQRLRHVAHDAQRPNDVYAACWIGWRAGFFLLLRDYVGGESVYSRDGGARERILTPYFANPPHHRLPAAVLVPHIERGFRNHRSFFN